LSPEEKQSETSLIDLKSVKCYDSVKHKYTCQGYIALTAHFIDVGWKFENFGTGMATHEVHSSFIQHHEICKLVLQILRNTYFPKNFITWI
jgi:hypothetical protein